MERQIGAAGRPSPPPSVRFPVLASKDYSHGEAEAATPSAEYLIELAISRFVFHELILLSPFVQCWQTRHRAIFGAPVPSRIRFTSSTLRTTGLWAFELL